MGWNPIKDVERAVSNVGRTITSAVRNPGRTAGDIIKGGTAISAGGRVGALLGSQVFNAVNPLIDMLTGQNRGMGVQNQGAMDMGGAPDRAQTADDIAKNLAALMGDRYRQGTLFGSRSGQGGTGFASSLLSLTSPNRNVRSASSTLLGD